MGFFVNRKPRVAWRIPSNIEMPGITIVNGDGLEFREEYLDDCNEYLLEMMKDESIKEKFTRDGVPMGTMLVAATLNGNERCHSLKILLKNLRDLKLDFRVAKNDNDEILIMVEHLNMAPYFPITNKRRVGKVNPNKPDKVYKCIPEKIVRFIPGCHYSGKELPMAMEYNVSTNILKIYTSIYGRSERDYKLTLVDVGVWVSEYEMKAAIEAVSGLSARV